MEQIKIREVYKNKETGEFELTSNENGLITLGRNYMFDILEVFMSRSSVKNGTDKVLETPTDYKLSDDMCEYGYIQEIIKFDLPKEETAAKNILKNGFDFDEKHYVYLTTSTSMMKESDTELNTECIAFFIDDRYAKFKDTFETIISLGKLETKKYNKKDKDENEAICINKDIVARISLALSSAERVHLPNMKMCVLPEVSYIYANNYLQFPSKTVKNEKGEDVEVLDISKVEKYINGETESVLEKFTIEDQTENPIEHIALDGAGFIMPELLKDVKKEINTKHRKEKDKIDYDLKWIGIRGGMALKGLLIKFDWKKYLREEHNLQELRILDFWGNEINLFDYNVIVNGSMAKWADWYSSYAEYEKLVNKYGGYDNRFKELFEGFNIIKVNKNEAKHATETNYQIIQNLCLTPNELDSIAAEEKLMFDNTLLSENEKVRVATRRMMLGDISREDRENDELSASTKVHKLLQFDPKMDKLAMTFSVVNNLVNKKINEFAGGSIYVEGSYKTIMKCPISYIDSLVELKKNPDNYVFKKEIDKKTGKEIEVLKGIKGRISENGLQPNTNYCSGEIGNRVLARSPLNSPGELIRTELVKNKLLDKYFGDISNDILLYAWDDVQSKQSGADEDLDISLCIKNEIIYDSVIEDTDENGIVWSFRNQFDGGTNKQYFTPENYIDSIVNFRGNKIGSMAISGSVVSGKRIQKQLPDLKLKDGTLTSKFDLIKKISESYSKRHKAVNENDRLDKYEKEKEHLVLKKLKEMEIQRELNDAEKLEYTEEEHKKNILDNFQANKVKLYYLLYAQMKAIDSVKTGLSLDEEEAFIKEYIRKNEETGKPERKPRFVFHAKYKKSDKLVNYWEVEDSNSLLNNFCRKIMQIYGFKAREELSKKYKDDHLINELRDIDCDLNNELLLKITQLNDDYHDELDVVEVNKEIKEYREYRESERYEKDEEYALSVDDKLRELYIKRKPFYDAITVKTNIIYREKIKGKYPVREILKAVGKAKGNKEVYGNKVNIKSSFIMTFMWDEIDEYFMDIKNGKGKSYREDKNGEYRFLFKNYTTCEKALSKKKLGQEEIVKIGQRSDVLDWIKTDLKILSEEDKNKVNIDEIKVVTFKDGYLFTENKDEIQVSLGKVYNNKGKYYPNENREFEVYDVKMLHNEKKGLKNVGIYFELFL